MIGLGLAQNSSLGSTVFLKRGETAAANLSQQKIWIRAIRLQCSICNLMNKTSSIKMLFLYTQYMTRVRAIDGRKQVM